MKFNLTWTQEKTVEIDVVDMAAAEEYGVKMIGRLGGFPVAKLLAIHEIKPDRRGEDKPPTPFGRPPGGTLGGGERAPIPPPVDQIARAA